jgi:hypothetical protein
MIEHHDHMVEPDEDTKVWRYLDFTKFVSMLDKRALYFSRVDKLEDRFEGAYAKASAERLKANLLAESPECAAQIELFMQQHHRHDIFVNCWHMNRHESDAMWKQYVRTNEGVAIQSTYKSLSGSLRSWRYPLFAGKITYVDYDCNYFPPHSLYLPVLHKRRSFEHENELRIIHSHQLIEIHKFGEDGIPPAGGRPMPPPPDPGLAIPVDLEALVEQVYVAPTTATWFRELVKSVLVKYALIRDVIRSDLDNDPVW